MHETQLATSTLFPRFFLALLALAVLSQPAVGQRLIGTVPVGRDPYSIAVNSTTHKVYVANKDGGTVTVIDESNLSTVNVSVPGGATYLAVDEETNKVYVSSFASMAVIDGATNSATSINVDAVGPVVVNPVTDKIYVISAFGVTVIDGVTLSTINVTAGTYPVGIAVNSVTNKIYVSNSLSNNVTVIDGTTNDTTSVSVRGFLGPVVVNTNTNKTYVSAYNQGDSIVTVIDGATLSTTRIDLGHSSINAPPLDLDQLTNKIYVAVNQDQYANFVIVIDGASLGVSVVTTGPRAPVDLAVEPITNRIYVTYTDYGVGSGLAVIDGATNDLSNVFSGYTTAVLATESATNRVYIANYSQSSVWVVDGFSILQFVPMNPCRLVDTRLTGNLIQGGTSQSFPLPQDGTCGSGIPANAAAYALNVTLVPPPGGTVGFLTIWPTGGDQPGVSLMNSWDGRFKANAAIVPAGSEGAVSVFSSDTTNVVLDIDGYFVPPGDSTLAFYPLPPCRVADTRWQTGSLGGPYLHSGQQRDLPILQSQCGIPSSAQAYSFNFTVIPRSDSVWVFTAWPAGQDLPGTSTLNAPTGTVVANAAIVPTGTGGDINVLASNDADLAIDVNGYFAPPGTGGLSLYAIAPCRVLDTRKVGNGEPFSGVLAPPVNVVGSGCGVSSNAQALVFNATVVPAGVPLWLLTLWPDGGQLPNASTLNAWDAAVTSNMAIVPTTNGSIDAEAAGLTQLILDISGYFAP